MELILLHFYSMKDIPIQISLTEDVSTPLAFHKRERRYKKSPHNYILLRELESVEIRTIALIVILNFEGNGPSLDYKRK